MTVGKELNSEVGAVIEAAYRLSEDVGAEVEAVLAQGRAQPLSDAELRSLLQRAVTLLRERALARGISISLDDDLDRVVGQILEASGRSARDTRGATRVTLQARNGIGPSPVFPLPMFHGKEVPMNGGWVRITEIELWENNERLEIHVAQFAQRFGRQPNPQELLDLMMSKASLPGITDADQFEILSLARSIATNGVRKPPIIDLDGTLLDGNRRVTACNFILNNDEFTAEQKRRAEWLYVWQLTEHATDDDRDRVVVSLNFEPDYKEEWPDYIKARKVYQEWESVLALEGSAPNNRRQAQLKKELSMRFALGPTTNVVNRYLKMMDWADQFEAYQVEEKHRDTFEVQHRSSEAFQYFDELSKGQSEGGVAFALGQDDALRHAVFDLLFDGRFVNWRQIRDLKHVAADEDARELLFKARNEPDADKAEEYLEQSIRIAKARRAEERKIGANTRIEAFVKWLMDVPVGAFSDGTIKKTNLERLLTALQRVETVVRDSLGTGGQDGDT